MPLGLEKNTAWPPRADRKRLERYTMMEALYKGDRNAWRGLKAKLASMATGGTRSEELRLSVDAALDGTAHYKTFNLVRFITEKFAQLIFNHPIRVNETHDNADAIAAQRRLLRENRARDKGKRALRYAMTCGDAVLKLRIGKKPEYRNARDSVLFDVVPPKYYFPEFEAGSNAVTRANVVMPKAYGERNYLLCESHIPGLIEYYLYEQEGSAIKGEIPFSGEAGGIWSQVWPSVTAQAQETLVDRILVFHLPWQAYDTAWGEPEFLHALDFFDEVNAKFGGLSHMHDVCTSPMLKIPQSAIMKGRDGTAEVQVRDVIPLAPGMDNSQIGWLEIQGSGPALTLEYIRDLIDYICMITSAPRSIFKTTRDGDSGESGVAIERKAVSTTLQSEGFIADFKAIMEEALWYAQRLEVEHGLLVEGDSVGNGVGEIAPAVYEPERPELDIHYGVVPDTNARVDNAIKKQGAGLITHADAVLESNPRLNPASLGAYLRKIEEEQAATPQGQAYSSITAQLRKADEDDAGTAVEKSPLDSAVDEAVKAGEETEAAAGEPGTGVSV